MIINSNTYVLYIISYILHIIIKYNYIQLLYMRIFLKGLVRSIVSHHSFGMLYYASCLQGAVSADLNTREEVLVVVLS